MNGQHMKSPLRQISHIPLADAINYMDNYNKDTL